MDIITYLLSRKYTDTSLIGGGAIKGKNCIISNITEITGGHRITFQWTLDDGTVENDYMDVMDGADGADGKGISSVSVNEEEHLIITYTDGTTSDAGKIEVASSVDSVNGKTGDVILNANDVGALPSDTPLFSGDYDDLTNKPTIPSATSDLTNDSNFVADAEYVHTDNNYNDTAKGIVDGVPNALAGKVDKVNGKGLSENDYTDADKTIVNGVTTALAGKVDKVNGKGLSTNDYTTEEKNKLSGIAAGAEANVQSDWIQSDDTADDFIKNKPNLATVATSGAYSDLSGTPSLATVATSGSYNDLSNKPTIPDELADLSDDSTHRVVTDTQISTWSGKQNALTEGTGINITADVVSIDNDVKTATDTFETINGGILSSLKVSLSPNQDLHGYDSPWVGGAGKNKCPDLERGTYDPSDGAKIVNNTRLRTVKKFFIKAGTYYISFTTSAVGKTLRFWYLLWASDAESGNPQTYNSGWINTEGVITISADTYMSIQFGYTDDDYITASDVKAQLELGSAKTDWTPYENICPISGHTEVDLQRDGKNILDAINHLRTTPSHGIIGTANADGSISISGTTDGTWAYITDNVGVSWEAGTYTFSIGTALTHNIYIELTYTDNTTQNFIILTGNQTATITTTKTIKTYCLIISTLTNGTSYNETYYLQVELGSTATAYEPYNGYQVTVNLGGTYYSGILDVVSGVLTITHVYYTFNTTDGEYNATNNRYLVRPTSIGIPSAKENYDGYNCISDRLQGITNRQGVGSGVGIYASGNIIAICGVQTSLADYQTWLTNNPVAVCYEIATPTPIQLSPTMVKALVGENHLSAPLEGQDITESVYSPLAKWNAVIDDTTASDDTTYSSNKLLTEINNAVDTKVNISAIGTNETSSTASKAYSYNQYFYKDGKFCKTIAPISEGAALVLNTNYIEKTIADVIEQLEEVTIDDLEGVVGFECDFKNKTSKRLANAKGLSAGTNFDAFSIYNLRRCNLADDGTVNAYYGDTGYAEDGSNGQVMVEGNKFYYRIIPLELEKAAFGYHIRKARYYVSPYPYKGFKPHPVCIDKDGNVNEHWYGSAFEGSIYDTSESAYILDDAQVMNTSEDLFCSIANAKPASGLTQNLSKPNVEMLAQNRGNDWHCSDVQTEMAITLLMAIEYATFEFQSKIALGVVNKTDDGSTNMSNNTGATSSLGNTTGMASGTNGLVSFSWRGYENLYGNIWKHVQGLNIWGDGTMLGGQAYIATDATYNESKHDDNYEPVGFYIANGAGYVSAFGYGEEKYDWVLLPSEKLGNSSDMIGDYNWVTDNLNGYRLARLGAGWLSGLQAGHSCWYLVYGVGSRSRAVGARLVYKKNSK